jgi:dihydrofolate reductase
MNLIFSADQNWGIGKGNALLFRASADMAHFKRMTTGATVVMGRKTFESLPGARALPDRENIVLTRDTGFSAPGVKVCHSTDELWRLLRDHDDENIFVIGGAEIYRLLEPYCDRALITRWQKTFAADAFGPNLGEIPGWVLIEESPVREDKGVSYTFQRFVRKDHKAWKKKRLF